MRNNRTYVSQRGGGRGFGVGTGGSFRGSGATWSRNRNTVRHTTQQLGTVSFSIIVSILVLLVGLVYVTQGTRATSYDYELSAIEAEIDELEAQKEDLAVEKARLTSIAASEKSEVASTMKDAKVSGYADE